MTLPSLGNVLGGSGRKRVENLHAGRQDVPDIACDEREAVHFGGCRKETVCRWNGIGTAQQRPGFCDRFIDRQHATGEG